MNCLTKVGFIFLNYFTAKHNHNYYCKDYENYEYAFNNARDSGSFMSSLHWLLSLLNLVILAGEFTSLAYLQIHY